MNPLLIGWVSQTSNAFNFQIMNSVIEFMGICLIRLNCKTNLNLFLGRLMYIFLNHPLNSKRSRKWEKMFYFYFKFFFLLGIHTSKTPQYYIIYWHVWFSRDYKLPSNIQVISNSQISIYLTLGHGEVFSPIDIKTFLNDH